MDIDSQKFISAANSVTTLTEQLAQHTKQLDEHRARLLNTRAALAAARSELTVQCRKRGIDPSHSERIAKEAKRLNERESIETRLRRALMTKAEAFKQEYAWKWRAADDCECVHKSDVRCVNYDERDDSCWFQRNDDRLDEYNGFWQCRFDEDFVLCDVCFDNHNYFARTLEEAFAAWSGDVRNVLDDEHRLLYEDEPLESVVARSVLKEQWRSLTIHVQCAHANCTDDQAVLVLLGQPLVALCKTHVSYAPTEQEIGDALYRDSDVAHDK